MAEISSNPPIDPSQSGAPVVPTAPTPPGASRSDEVFRWVDSELLVKLEEAIKLKDYAIRNNYDISEQAIKDLNHLAQDVREYFRSAGVGLGGHQAAASGLAQPLSSPSAPAASSNPPTSTAETLMTRVDMILRDLNQLTYPASLDLALSA